MVTLRPYRESDLDALYQICLATGDLGQDATGLYGDEKLLGHIYAAPYAVLEPEHVFVAEDDEGVAGYIVGTFDSDNFAARLERDWWPALRRHYTGIAQDELQPADRMRIATINVPERGPADIVARYPAHIHMNLLPRMQGQGAGTKLLQLWIAAAKAGGVTGIHLGANARNDGGVAFWTRSGFAPIETIGRTMWFGMGL